MDDERVFRRLGSQLEQEPLTLVVRSQSLECAKPEFVGSLRTIDILEIEWHQEKKVVNHWNAEDEMF